MESERYAAELEAQEVLQRQPAPKASELKQRELPEPGSLEGWRVAQPQPGGGSPEEPPSPLAAVEEHCALRSLLACALKSPSVHRQAWKRATGRTGAWLRQAPHATHSDELPD